MPFHLPEYKGPDFAAEHFISAPEAATSRVIADGVAPEGYHATTIFPEYFKVKGRWTLAGESRMDCVVVINGDGVLSVKEFRRLKAGDNVVIGRTEDGTEGIYVYTDGFRGAQGNDECFAFRTGRSRETSYSRDYDSLYELLKYERENGYIVWVLGPAVVFDSDSRRAMVSLVEHGFVDVIFAGNALATHDLEASIFKTALGQDIYTQTSMPNGHYNHLEVINKARRAGTLEALIECESITEGVVHSCIKNKILLVLAGSIRDDAPLPGVLSDVYAAQDAMREHTKKLPLF